MASKIKKHAKNLAFVILPDGCELHFERVESRWVASGSYEGVEVTAESNGLFGLLSVIALKLAENLDVTEEQIEQALAGKDLNARQRQLIKRRFLRDREAVPAETE